MSWYKSGFDGVDQEQARLDAQYGPSRFRVRAGDQQDAVFVDDDPVCIYEHNPKIDGNYRNWLTCLQGVSDNVTCCQKLGPNSRYYVGFITVVSCTEWLDKKGNKHQYEMKLFPAKLRSLKSLRRKKDDRGSLVACMYSCARDDDKSPSVGGELEFKRQVDLEKLFEVANYKGKKLPDLWDEAEANPGAMQKLMRTFQVKPDAEGKLPRIVPPFNYFEVLKPRSPKELQLTLGMAEVEPPPGSNTGSGGAVKSDDVPF